jgi:hypothetical protein
VLWQNSWFQTSEVSSLDEDFSFDEAKFSLEERSIFKTSEEIEKEGFSLEKKKTSEIFEKSYYSYSLEQGINKTSDEEIKAKSFSLHQGNTPKSIKETKEFMMTKQEGESHEEKPKIAYHIEPAKSSPHGQKIANKGCLVVTPPTSVIGEGPHVSKNMDKVVICAANVRQRGVAIEEKTLCQLQISKMTPDKEQQLEELMNLRIALANQCYHSKLHKVHLISLQAKQEYISLFHFPFLIAFMNHFFAFGIQFVHKKIIFFVCYKLQKCYIKNIKC